MASTNDHSVVETAGHAAEHGGGGLPQLDFSTWPSQIFWLLVTLVLLHWILSKLFLPRISGGIEDRHNTIRDDLDQASELKRKAEDAETAYADALQSARNKAQGIAAETNDAIKGRLAVATEEAEAQIAAQTSESNARIAAIQEGASENVSTIANDVAGAIVKKLLPKAASSDAITRAVAREIG